MSKQVAIVDDSKIIISSLKMSLKELERSGRYCFTYFTDPIAFCEAIKENAVGFDFFFLDINMPRMSGLEVTKCLRATPQYSLTPIYALTTEESRETQRLGINVGMNGWIVKLTTLGMVREQIRKTLEDVL
jgi:CheY-like chemotaxis protein